MDWYSQDGRSLPFLWGLDELIPNKYNEQKKYFVHLMCGKYQENAYSASFFGTKQNFVLYSFSVSISFLFM